MESFGAFAASVRDDAHEFTRNLTRDREVAEDLVQSAVTSVFARIEKTDVKGNSPWILSLLYRTILQYSGPSKPDAAQS